MTVAIRILSLLFLLVPMLAPLAHAQERVDLYQAKVLVPNQSLGERNQAMVDGLAEVILKTTGQIEALENPQVMAALARASSYLVEWRYENTDETLEIDGRQVPASRLVLRYSSNGIDTLLRESRLPIWPANRPTLLVWLIVDGVDGRRAVNSTSAPAVTDALQAIAQRRGLPIIRPLMDLEDQVALPASKLWALDYDNIRRASERYDADSVLIGRLTETSRDQWRGSWTLMHGGRNIPFDTAGPDLTDMMAAGLDQVVGHYVSLYAITPQEGAREALTFQVDGVGDFENYVRFTNYLENLAAVRRYDVVAVQGNSLLLYVYPAGDEGVLRDALALDERLVVIPDLSVAGLPPGSPSNPLRYRWR